MMKILASFFLVCLLAANGFAQDNTKRAKALGVSFILNDYATAERIRSSSIERVFRDDDWAKLNEMSPGLALSYFNGVKEHLDFAATLGASYVNYSIPGKTFDTDALLLEADASINLKMFSEDYWISPYLSAGIGASKYRNYYGAFIPLGLGLKINFYDEAHLFFTTQYRIPVISETAKHHLVYSLGVAGVIGKK
jgi:OOP family OmpA-OmpF porin